MGLYRLIVLASFFLCFRLEAQVVAVKTNLLYDASATVNLGAEVAFCKHLTLDVSGNYNDWDILKDKSYKHWMVQPELRYWIRDRFNGHFLGLQGTFMDYDFSGISLLNVMKSDHAYDGHTCGIGLSYGYQLYLSPHWNIEFTAGAGYLLFKYDKYDNYGLPEKAEFTGRYKNNYLGLTKVGLSIVYIIK